jgi:hypothetical protein
MSIAREIALATSTPEEAAAAIRERLATLTPDLVPGSGPWNDQVELLSGVVASIWREQGRAIATTPNAVAIERSARGGARPNSGPPPALTTVQRAIDTLARYVAKAEPLPYHEALVLFKRVDQLQAQYEAFLCRSPDYPDDEAK